MQYSRMIGVAGALVYAIAFSAHAQNPGERSLPTQKAPAAKKPPTGTPANLQPLPEPPPPPPGMELDPSLEPEVTIQRRGTTTVEEFRIRGRLYMIRVTPAHGVPYYLIDENGRGDFTRFDSYDTGTRPPMWVIHQF